MADYVTPETIAAGLALITAGMNVYSFFGTGKQIDNLIETVRSQGAALSTNFDRLSQHLDRSQDQTDRLMKTLGKMAQK